MWPSGLGMLAPMLPQPPSATPSPCVRNCTLNDQDVCLGCGRTLTDITGWSAMSEADKAACVARARQNLQALGRPWPAEPMPQRRG
jgi:predicted Fe-S protein YdhL (DUF1289 family)